MQYAFSVKYPRFSMPLLYIIAILSYFVKIGSSYDFVPYISSMVKELEIPNCQIVISRANLLKSKKVLKDLSMLGRPCSLTLSLDLKLSEFIIGGHLEDKSLKKALYVFSQYQKFKDISIDQEILFLNASSGEWYEYYTVGGYASKNILGKMLIDNNKIQVIHHFFVRAQNISYGIVFS